MNTVLIVLAVLAGMLVFSIVVLVLFTLYTARKVEAVLPAKGRFIDVPGARLHVREFGDVPGDTGGDAADAPALLLVHGLGGNMGNFTYGLASRLAARHRVVVVDRPGSGYSTREAATPADLSTQAASLAALVRTLGLGKTFVVGHSLGGAVALTMALEHPRQVAGLALLAPLTHMREDVPEVFKALAIASPRMRRIVAWTLAVPGSIARSSATMDAIFGPEAVPKDFAIRGGGLLGLRPAAFLSASSDMLAAPERLAQIQSRYHELRLPLHVLFAKDDRILDWKTNGQALVDKVPGARLELIDGGHMIPVTQVEATAAFIEQAVAARDSTVAGTAAG